MYPHNVVSSSPDTVSVPSRAISPLDACIKKITVRLSTYVFSLPQRDRSHAII